MLLFAKILPQKLGLWSLHHVSFHHSRRTKRRTYMSTRKLTSITTETFVHLFLIIVALVFVFPFLWLVFTSLKPPEEVLSWPPVILPKHWTLENYFYVFETAPFGWYYINSLFFSSTATASILLTSGLAGYVFAKFRFFGRDLIFYVLLAAAAIPMQAYLVMLYIMVSRLGGIDTYWGLLLPASIMSFGIFFIRQNVYAIPDSLVDSARIDGASEFKIFFHIIVPLIKPALSALGIYAFTTRWSLYIWPLVVLSTNEKFTTELGLTAFTRRFVVDYGPITAAASICCIPALVVFIIFNRQIIRGIALTGIKE